MSGYFWYGCKKHSPEGNPPQWLSELTKSTTSTETENNPEQQSEVEAESDPAKQQSGVNGDTGQTLESRRSRYFLRDRVQPPKR